MTETLLTLWPAAGSVARVPDGGRGRQLGEPTMADLEGIAAALIDGKREEVVNKVQQAINAFPALH